MKCSGVTKSARLCRRDATVEVTLTTGKVVGYCAQHAAGKGVMRMLLPFPWDVRSIREVR